MRNSSKANLDFSQIATLIKVGEVQLFTRARSSQIEEIIPYEEILSYIKRRDLSQNSIVVLDMKEEFRKMTFTPAIYDPGNIIWPSLERNLDAGSMICFLFSDLSIIRLNEIKESFLSQLGGHCQIQVLVKTFKSPTVPIEPELNDSLIFQIHGSSRINNISNILNEGDAIFMPKNQIYNLVSIVDAPSVVLQFIFYSPSWGEILNELIKMLTLDENFRKSVLKVETDDYIRIEEIKAKLLDVQVMTIVDKLLTARRQYFNTGTVNWLDDSSI